MSGAVGDESFQLCEGRAAIYRISGQRHCIAQMIGPSSGDERGGGVEQYHVAASGFLPGQYFADQHGVLRGVSAGDVFQRCSLEAELFRCYFVGVYLAFTDFSDARGAGNGDFVQAVAAVNYQRSMQT